ncbi:endonuclease [Campylobacterota bacterium]
MSLKQLYVVLLLFPLALAASPYPQPKSFSQATNIFKKIDFDYTRTAFSDEVYVYDPTTCMDKLYVKGDEKRTVVFVRIVPEKRMLQQRKCGTQKICVKYNKETYGGARCCRTTDELYRAYDRDIFNIMPIVQENTSKMEEPPIHIRGNIARVYLYMNMQYGLNLSYTEQMKYLKWHHEDRVDEKECKIYKQIVDLQGRMNPWIEPSCKAEIKEFHGTK